MTLINQLLWGSALLCVSAILHVGVLAAALALVRRLRRTTEHWRATMRYVAATGTSFSSVVVAHTLQVWVWAVAVLWLQALPDFEASVYFSLVTATTVGYGDVVLPEGFRIFGGMGAVTGLLTFGLSTAFLIGVVERIGGEARD
ncbi:MAG: potassium channel family protein [Pseudomonadota bacterium]